MCWELKGGPGEERKGGKAHTLLEFHLCSGQRCGRAAIHFPLSPGWAFKPLTHSSGGGQGAALPGSPRATLLKPPGLWERGKREEVPNTDQSVQQNLKEQSRDSMVLEPYYRNAEEREKVERRKRERGREEEEREEEDKEKGKRREK